MIDEGDCYEVHAKLIAQDLIDNRGEKFKGSKLCHGEVWHDFLGWHGHCWIEIDDSIVMDVSNGHDVRLPREKYYALGKVKEVVRYTPKEAMIKLLEEGTYGSWHELTIKREQ